MEEKSLITALQGHIQEDIRCFFLNSYAFCVSVVVHTSYSRFRLG